MIDDQYFEELVIYPIPSTHYWIDSLMTMLEALSWSALSMILFWLSVWLDTDLDWYYWLNMIYNPCKWNWLMVYVLLHSNMLMICCTSL